MHLLPRFYDVTEGQITIDGQDIRDFTLHSLRRNVGIVQQDVYLFSASIRDNIAYGAVDASFEEVVRAAQIAQLGIQQVAFAVGPEGVAIQAVGPRREEGNTAEPGLRPQLRGARIGKPQEILPAHLPFISHVADRARDRDFGPARGVGELHHLDPIHHQLPGRVVRIHRISSGLRNSSVVSLWQHTHGPGA